MMKCICVCKRWIPPNDCLYTFIITFTELNLEVDLRINFNEFKCPDEVITSIIREVKNKANEKIMAQVKVKNMYKLYLVENKEETGYGDFVSMVIKSPSLNLAYEEVNDYLLKYYQNINIKITELTQDYIKNSNTFICECWNSD